MRRKNPPIYSTTLSLLHVSEETNVWVFKRFRFEISTSPTNKYVVSKAYCLASCLKFMTGSEIKNCPRTNQEYKCLSCYWRIVLMPDFSNLSSWHRLTRPPDTHKNSRLCDCLMWRREIVNRSHAFDSDVNAAHLIKCVMNHTNPVCPSRFYLTKKAVFHSNAYVIEIRN